jgi:hypothetical protein
MDCGHQSAFDKIFKMADTWRESSKMSITALSGKQEGRASKALLIFIGKRKFLMSYSVLCY